MLLHWGTPKHTPLNLLSSTNPRSLPSFLSLFPAFLLREWSSWLSTVPMTCFISHIESPSWDGSIETSESKHHGMISGTKQVPQTEVSQRGPSWMASTPPGRWARNLGILPRSVGESEKSVPGVKVPRMNTQSGTGKTAILGQAPWR